MSTALVFEGYSGSSPLAEPSSFAGSLGADPVDRARPDGINLGPAMAFGWIASNDLLG
jgi:hypothetical protein